MYGNWLGKRQIAVSSRIESQYKLTVSKISVPTQTTEKSRPVVDRANRLFPIAQRWRDVRVCVCVNMRERQPTTKKEAQVCTGNASKMAESKSEHDNKKKSVSQKSERNGRE